jgi:hypothetical protein
MQATVYKGCHHACIKRYNDVMAEVIEHKPEILVPNIDDHMFDNDDDDDDNNRIDTIDQGGGTSSVPLVVVRLCLTNLVEEGWKKLNEMNIGKVQLVADKQAQLKINTRRYDGKSWGDEGSNIDNYNPI